MSLHSPKTKLVVGMRHPVMMLQSFYNYRVTEIKTRGLDESIPSLEEIVRSPVPWKGVSTHSTRFEMFLMQLGKTPLKVSQMEAFLDSNYDLAIAPTESTVFLYTLDQLEDTDASRSGAFRSTLQDYLGLKQPIAPFGHENINHAAKDSAYDELINICDDKWASLRATLVKQGAISAEWIREELLQSSDIVVGNKEHFLQTLMSWSQDPCQAAVTSKA